MSAINKIFFPIILASLLSACATTPLTVEEKSAVIGNYVLPNSPKENEAYVYITRPDSVGFAVRFKVFLDGKKGDGQYIGYTRGSQYLAFPVSPGNHTIFSKAENWASVDINASDGDVLFIKQTPRIGILFAGNNLEKINPLDGKYQMKKYNLKEGKYIESDDTDK